jgi:hypothetical protein
VAHYTMRCNLAAAIFPFATDLWGRSIIVPQYDQNYDRTIVSPSDTDKDKGIPQAFYMHNCMPTSHGFQAVGYTQKLPAMAGAPTDFDAAFPIQNSDLARFIFVPALGKNYIWDQAVGAWASISPIAAGLVPSNVIVTVAQVQSQSYIWYQGIGGYTYNDTTKLLASVALIGLVATAVKGITGATGYLIAWDDTTVVWSSAINVLDFTPSLVTGAGGGSIAEAKGRIICCLPINSGFVVYCEKNIVVAKYSGNIRFPFIFAELPGSAGITSPEQVSWQSNLEEHYAWTTAGVMKVSKSAATPLFPEITDFLSMKFFEDFDEVTRTFSSQKLGTVLNAKVTAIAARFLVFSYGVNYPDYTHALVFDLVLKRWGKLKITHRDCFQWNVPQLYGTITYDQLAAANVLYGDLDQTTYDDFNSSIKIAEEPRGTIAFLQQDGTVKTVDFSLYGSTQSGVLMLGKFQFMRNQRIQHQASEVETLESSGTFATYIVTSQDGKTLDTPVAAYLQKNSAKMRRYLKRKDGANLSLLFIGAFSMVTTLLEFTRGGDIE